MGTILLKPEYYSPLQATKSGYYCDKRVLQKIETCLARGLHTTCRLCGPSWVQWRPCRRHRGREKLLVLWPIPVLLTCGHMFDNFFLKSLMFYIFFGWCRCDGAMSSHKTLDKTFAFGPKHCMMTGGNQPTMAGTREFRASSMADDETSPCLARLAGGSISWREHDKNERLRTRGSSWRRILTWNSTEGGVTVLRRWHDAETLTFRHGDFKYNNFLRARHQGWIKASDKSLGCASAFILLSLYSPLMPRAQKLLYT